MYLVFLNIAELDGHIAQGVLVGDIDVQSCTDLRTNGFIEEGFHMFCQRFFLMLVFAICGYFPLYAKSAVLICFIFL